ncbi:MAG: energy-coupling factor ABC transporter ATP-binding protein [Lachnospiraceae bacterium]|nr:energy-coupling factor ABC transporter ATP-binding protein [Lachnospiraceae bacterium]
MSESIISLKNISYKYDDQIVLDDISYDFKMGKCYCIMGPNGCGKSTLFRILNGLSFPTKGEFYFDGKLITEKYLKDENESRDFHKRIGFVFQDSEVQLFTRSVIDEVAFGLYQLGLDQKEIERRVYYYLDLLEIRHLENRAPFNLSGGEKKRVALASVFSMKPEVLILDEPLAGLDEDGQEFVLEFLKKQKSEDRLIIISTHNKELCDAVSDEIINIGKNHKIIS